MGVKDLTKLKNYKPTEFMAEGSHYDKQAADYAVNFIECLSHTKCTWAGKPFKLLEWQEKIIRDIFGIVKSNGYRQFNTAYIEVPKKNGKELSLDTLIPTPDGFTTMGEIQVGDTVFDENGIKLVYTGYTKEIFPTLTFRIENSTQNSYMVHSEDVSINDSMISTSILETVAGGKKSNVEMVMLDSDLKKNGIEKIEKVEFKLSITNSDDFKDSFESGVITITNP